MGDEKMGRWEDEEKVKRGSSSMRILFSLAPMD